MKTLIRKVEEAELLAYEEAAIRRRKALDQTASALGFRLAQFNDPPWPLVCPVCAANVSLSNTAAHMAWHDA